MRKAISSEYFLCADLVIDILNVAEPSDRLKPTDQLEYVFIDDVSSLDENHLIELAEIWPN